MQSIAVIPARGGSKRIPKKNIREFCGKPMIAWSIETATESGLFDKVFVSTDSKEIADISIAYGAEAPFFRPSELSDDKTATRPVIIHAIKEISAKYGAPEYVCCIYATAPFIEVNDLIKGFNILKDEGSDFIFTVSSYGFPIQRAIKITPNNRVKMFWPEHRLTRSQDLEEAYHDAGQFYWGRTDSFLNDVATFSSASIPLVIPRHRVQDIDTWEDWERAELMFSALLEKSK